MVYHTGKIACSEAVINIYNFNTVFLGFGKKLLADLESSDLGFMFLRTKKFMNLFKKLTARSGIFIKYNWLYTMFCSFDCCGKSRRAVRTCMAPSSMAV